MSFQPSAAINAFSFGRERGMMGSGWGHALTKSSAMALKKAWEKADMDLELSEKEPKFFVSPEVQYITLFQAAKYAGVKYDRKEYDKLFRS